MAEIEIVVRPDGIEIRPDRWQFDDKVVMQLAMDLLTARRGADRAKLRRLRRVGEAARIAAFAAEQRAIAMPTHENVTNAFAKQLVVAALNLADDPKFSEPSFAQ